ncbi:toll/interleukin-1 receptor domain-containing protein [Streptomyces sp. ISL-22]|uniref:toll/interleukin-1 receptor domain-containing protein n=1 Tax=unclassified Streptomyces TaxID=2593676 RepID=UPI001BEBD54A|nr:MULTISPECIES: toll/interleukin-1 receptor domain-containing protein [unclassified Streptomyces]MBT2419823.1 toll/interleukin-1 receptor domain-containing protein [Streptomyces sp. ISL-24]MBT2435212.1 toll/interleukin-1 receptor domain-containing protein [Streptomyces sp. ISL-22]
MPDVFINYRSGDGDQAAATIEGALSTRFGTDRIYRASKSIPPGAPFDAHLIHGVRRSGALLALIGPGWVNHPALNKEGDWVSREIQEAFLCDIRVIPVLIGRRTERPAKEALPRPLQKLADCQSLRYDHRNNEYDLKQIGDTLARLVPELAAVDRASEPEPSTGGTHHTAGNVHGTSVQAGTVSGDIGTVKDVQGQVHIGPSTRNVRLGDGGTYFEGDNNGGIHHSFGRSRRDEDDDR